MITLVGRDKSAFHAYYVFENCNWIFDCQIGMHSVQVDLQNFLLYVFFSQKIIKESLPSLFAKHGRKFCLIAYLIYSLLPALGPQCHHFVPQVIGIILWCNTAKLECAMHRNGNRCSYNMEVILPTKFAVREHKHNGKGWQSLSNELKNLSIEIAKDVTLVMW